MSMDDDVIWRYMDFTKFVDLLSNSKLFFCRADKFEDPFEGSIPKKIYHKRLREIESQPSLFGDEQVMFERHRENSRKYVYINCWHRNEMESAAMWKLYLQSQEGVAIKTTRERVLASIKGDSYSVWSVPVKYIDYDNDDVPIPTSMAPYRYKRRSFQHERELRYMIFAESIDKDGNENKPLAEAGIGVPVNISVLVNTVVVSPTAAAWFVDLVEAVVKKFEYDLSVEKSSITLSKPLFI